MAINLGSAYGKVTLDSSGLQKGVTNAKVSLENLAVMGEKVGTALSSLGQKMTIGLTLPIIGIGVASVKAASDLQESKDRVNAVYGDMSDAVIKWADNSALAWGMSKKDSLEAVGAFGNLFNSFNVGTKKSADMSEQLVQLASDLAAFHHVDTQTALDQLQSGLVGRGIELKKWGVFLDAATVKEKAMAMGLADANGVVSDAALVQARYQLILEQTANVQGYFAKTTGDLGGQTQIMKAQFQNALAMMGTNLLPLLIKIAQAVNTMLEAFNKMTPAQQNMVLIFLGIVAVAGPILSVLGSVITTISGLVTILGTAGISVGAIVTALGTAATALFGFAASALAALGPILLLAAGPALLYFAFKNNFMGITTTAKQLWFLIQYGFGQMWAEVNAGAKAGLGVLQDGWNSWIENNKSSFANWGTWMRGAWQNVLNFFARTRDWIVSVFRIDWGMIGRNIIQGIINGLLSGLTSLANAAKLAAQTALNQIKATLGIHSPSQKAFELGAFTGQGYMLGLQRNMDPNAIARTIAQPVMNNTASSQQTLIQNFASGLTIRQAQAMIDENNDRIFNRLSNMLGSA